MKTSNNGSINLQINSTQVTVKPRKLKKQFSIISDNMISVGLKNANKEFKQRPEYKKFVSFIENAHHYLLDHVPFNADQVFVAGGFFASFYHDLEIRDIDVYANSEAAFARAKFIYNKRGYKPLKDYSLFAKFQHPEEDLQIDLIGFHSPKNVNYIHTYDFTCVKIAMDSYNFYYDYDAIEHMRNKQLVPNMNSRSLHMMHNLEHNAITRLVKYFDKGFKFTEQYDMYEYAKKIRESKIINDRRY